MPLSEIVPVGQAVTDALKHPIKALKLVEDSSTKLPKLYAEAAAAEAALERACDALNKAQQRHAKALLLVRKWEIIRGNATNDYGQPMHPDHLAYERVKVFNALT